MTDVWQYWCVTILVGDSTGVTILVGDRTGGWHYWWVTELVCGRTSVVAAVTWDRTWWQWDRHPHGLGEWWGGGGGLLGKEEWSLSKRPGYFFLLQISVLCSSLQPIAVTPCAFAELSDKNHLTPPPPSPLPLETLPDGTCPGYSKLHRWNGGLNVLSISFMRVNFTLSRLLPASVTGVKHGPINMDQLSLRPRPPLWKGQLVRWLTGDRCQSSELANTLSSLVPSSSGALHIFSGGRLHRGLWGHNQLELSPNVWHHSSVVTASRLCGLMAPLWYW